ncbi:hypothetical protein M5K25_002759 [Dendrobium thyrsiflorum]|uniref:Uncharacterized protein n=1 Tax=Dendrobium thyrsiflorum TaxID=117978 RepID=A0ABD0VNG5_DENTH
MGTADAASSDLSRIRVWGCVVYSTGACLSSPSVHRIGDKSKSKPRRRELGSKQQCSTLIPPILHRPLIPVVSRDKAAQRHRPLSRESRLQQTSGEPSPGSYMIFVCISL